MYKSLGIHSDPEFEKSRKNLGLADSTCAPFLLRAWESSVSGALRWRFILSQCIDVNPKLDVFTCCTLVNKAFLKITGVIRTVIPTKIYVKSLVSLTGWKWEGGTWNFIRQC